MSIQGLSARGLLVWLICALFFTYEFLLRTVLGTFQQTVVDAFHLSLVQFALLSATAYQMIYGLLQLPVGMLLEKWGLKRALVFATLICAISNIGFATNTRYEALLFFRILMGAGSSFGFICLLVAVYDWFPRKNIAFFIGISQFIGTLGPMMAAGPLKSLSQSSALSLQALFFDLALVAGVLMLLAFGFVEKNKQKKGAFIILTKPASVWASLFSLMRQKQVWWIGIYSSSVYFSIEYLSENEGIRFLVEKGLNETFSAYLITLSWLGYAIGCPLWGFASDALKQRRPVMIISAFCVVASLLGIFYLPLPPSLMVLAFVFLGLGAAGQSIGFAIVSEYCQNTDLTVGLAFNNALIISFSAFSAPFLGWILSREGGQVVSLSEYQYAFGLIVLCASVGLIAGLFFIRETYCKAVNENTVLDLGKG